MGLRSGLDKLLGVSRPQPDAIKSPFSEGQLQEIVWSEIFGANYAPVSRSEAMSIPALSKARNLICATPAKMPLRAATKDGLLPDEKQPEWMYRTDNLISPFQRILWTLDDLLFYGDSLWYRTNGADGFPLTVERVAYDRWKVNANGQVLINEVVQSGENVIYFPGSIEGLLNKDGSSIRAAKAIAEAVESRVKSPIPVMEIHATGDGGHEPTKSEQRALVASYNSARRDPDGATVFTPSGVELKPHGDKSDSGFMVEGRNAVRLDMANITGVPAALLDGSVSAASLTYSTQEGRRNEFVDYGLSMWMETITGRLSADDVVPRGQSVVFDQTDFLTTIPSPIGADKQD